MTSTQLAEKVGCSQQWIFHLKRKFPDRCPNNFDDVAGWKELLKFSRMGARVKYVRGATQPREGQNGDGFSDIQRLTKARAGKVEIEQAILAIELEATRRNIINQSEVVALFAKVATIVRGRLSKMRADLPSALLGLDAPSIDRVLGEKMEEALSAFVIPDDFFEPRSRI